MADDAQGGPTCHPVALENELPEDAATRAARKELKQSSISDQSSKDEQTAAAVELNHSDTLELDGPKGEIDEPREQVSSPKKKRGHDQLDGDRDMQDNGNASISPADSASARAARLQPEKKRHRDEDTTESHASRMPESPVTRPAESHTQGKSGRASKPAQETSAIAFAASGFGKLASGSSGFAALGSSQGRGFATAQPTVSSSFAPKRPGEKSEKSEITTSTNPTLSFGPNAALSPFARLSPVANGARVFGSGLAISGMKPMGNPSRSGAKLLQSDKAARPFGAPDSDEDEEDEDDEGEDGIDGQPEDGVRDNSPEKEFDEKKRPKLHKVEVDDGEAGEVTVMSVRAKMFSLDKETGWKERGAGMLKINVPHACVEFDNAGAIIPGSFDASGLEALENPGSELSHGPKVARLILRQDQTHRVILNTAILPAMTFQEKATLNSVGVLFTALEGSDAKPVSTTMRMSAANAKLFLNEVNAIQREIQGS